MDFLISKEKKESKGFIACDRNFDIKVGRTVLVSNYYLIFYFDFNFGRFACKACSSM
jgi:hypothetical protein